MPGTLYVVTTPIGNLSDLTPRAAETFALVDFVAAEDTRVTRKLLSHLGLKKELVSYYEHNARERGELILDRLAAGESCALCSDAGVPAVSDPGEALVADAHARGLRVVPIPGGSAAIAALCVSGQPTGRFCFEGFLPQNRAHRKERLEKLQTEERTLLFYEAPHKLPATLQHLAAAFGGERPVTVCRELTKLHEQVWPTTLAEAAAHYAAETPRGEFVLVVAGAPKQEPAILLPEEAVAYAMAKMQAENLTASAAAREAAKYSGRPKGEIYKLLLRHK